MHADSLLSHRNDHEEARAAREPDFDRPFAGQSSADNLLNYQAQGAFLIALQNLYRAGNPVVQEIVKHGSSWKKGVPAN